MPRQHYDIFKHTVRTKLPKKIRYATVCRKCKKNHADKCWTCKIEFAQAWGRAY